MRSACAAFGFDVADESRSASQFFHCDGGGLHLGVCAEPRFDFFGRYEASGDLDLSIDPPEELVVVRLTADQVTRAVPLAATPLLKLGGLELGLA